MATYNIDLTETNYGRVEVEAENDEEAYKKAREKIRKGEIIWSGDNKEKLEIASKD